MNKNEKLLNRLNDLLDPETYEAVVSEFAGERIYFPCGTVDRERRDQEIRKAYYQGTGVEVLACQYAMSYSQIRRIINRRN